VASTSLLRESTLEIAKAVTGKINLYFVAATVFRLFSMPLLHHDDTAIVHFQPIRVHINVFEYVLFFTSSTCFKYVGVQRKSERKP